MPRPKQEDADAPCVVYAGDKCVYRSKKPRNRPVCQAFPPRAPRNPMVPPVKSLDIILDQNDCTFFLTDGDTWITGSVWICLYDPSASAIQRAWIQGHGAGTNRWVSKTSDKIYEKHAVYYDRLLQLNSMESSAYTPSPRRRRRSHFHATQSQDGQIYYAPEAESSVAPKSNGILANGYQAMLPQESEDGCCCRFSFRMPLPSNLPSTFVCDFGSCTYKLIVTVLLFDSISGVCEVSMSKTFKVVASVNLTNYAPLLATHNAFPLRIHDTHEFVSCCFVSWGCMMASLHLEKSGYVMGETIWGHIYLNNQSRKTIRQLRVQLIQKYKFHAASRFEGAPDYKEAQSVVAEVTLAGLRIGHGKTSLRQPLNVPKTDTDAIPYHSGSSIEIRHTFCLIIKPGITLELPVFIGTWESPNLLEDDETPL